MNTSAWTRLQYVLHEKCMYLIFNYLDLTSITVWMFIGLNQASASESHQQELTMPAAVTTG